MNINHEAAEQAIKDLLKAMGCDDTKEPYINTPHRYVKALEEVFNDEEQVIKDFEEPYSGPISITNHQAWSLCPHHLLPTLFSIDVTYMPKNGRVLGLSKLPRLINKIVREDGPALQERVTWRIVDELKPYAKGVRVIIRGDHLCTKMRGIKSTGSMVTELMWEEPPAITKLH